MAAVDEMRCVNNFTDFCRAELTDGLDGQANECREKSMMWSLEEEAYTTV